MLNYVGTNAVITYNFEFCQMTRWEGEDNLKGYIRFDNSHYLTNISDTNLIGDGYVNLSDGIIYWRKSKYQEYYSYVDNTVFIKDYNNQKSFARITYYDEDALVANLYKFYANIESGEDPGGGGGGGDTPSTSVTDPSLVSIEHTELRCREKQQVRPSDHSQDWTDTDVVRDKEECDVQVDSCECGREYQWVSVGTICDGVNKCDKLKYQYKDECNGSWNDYSPLIYKIGDVIEYDSSECGTVEYKEEWSEPFCGSYLNDNYGLSLSSVNKYKIKIPYIKRKDEFVWSELNCNTLLEYELFYTNSFECGYKTTRTVSETFETSICGSVIKTKYPSLSGSVIDTYSYDVIKKEYQETAPYPTNTDDMTQDEWVWTTTSTTYSVTNGKADCGCGYRTTSWVTGDTVYCGSELSNTIIGADIFQITSVEGDWYNNGKNVFTSKHIKDNEMSVLKINFTMATSGSVIVDYNMSSESGDKMYFGYIDSATTNNWYSSSSYSTSLNGYNSTVTYTNVSAGSHTLWIWYKQDSSGRSGRDNGTVYLYSSYSPFYKYKIAEEYKYCSGTFYEKTGNKKLVSYSQVECDCGWSSVNYYVSKETECGYNLGEGYVDTTEYTKIQGYKYNCSTSGISTSDTTSLSEHIINDMYWWSATTTNSYTCGYKGEKWVVSGTVCCGKLDEEIGINSIEGLGTNSGEWYEQSDGVYSIYPMTSTGYSQTLIFRFTSNTDVKLIMGKTTSSSYVEFHSYSLDSNGNSYTTHTSTANTRTYTISDDNEHTIMVRMYYRSSSYLNYVPTIQLQIAGCSKYGLYNLEYKTITTDGINYVPVIPYEYRYGSLISGNSSECDYIPATYQWVAICEDVTFETANTTKDEKGDYVDVDGCSVCQTNSGYHQLYRLQKKQVSYDFGETWSDVIPIEVRPDELLGTDGQNGKGYKCSDEPTE